MEVIISLAIGFGLGLAVGRWAHYMCKLSDE